MTTISHHPSGVEHLPRGQSIHRPQLEERPMRTLHMPVGEEQELYGAEDIRSQKFQPQTLFFIGRRGAGKTLAQTALASLQQKRYRQAKVNYQVWSNYDLTFAERSTPKLVDELIESPWLAAQKLLCIDEVASAFDSRRAMAGVSVEFSNFLTQIRKLRSECMFATQFPQVVDTRVLLQVDLFVRTRSVMEGRAIVLEIYDWWGQYTGDDSRKPWPPEPDMHDWELLLINTDTLWGTYDTYEMIPYIHSDSRDAILEAMGYIEAVEELHDAPAEDSVLDDVAEPNPTLDEYINSLPAVIVVNQRLRFAQRSEPSLITPQDFATELIARGWLIEYEGSRIKARRAE